MSVLLIGDSMAGGLSQALSVESYHTDGVSTTNYVSEAQRRISNSNAQVILIALGTNDITSGKTPTQTANAVRQILQAAGGRYVLWILPPAFYNERGAGIISAIESSGVGTFDSLSLHLPLNGYGGVHPDSNGFRVWASAILDYLNSVSLDTTPTNETTDTGETTDTTSRTNDKPQTNTSTNVVGIVAAFLVADWLFRG